MKALLKKAFEILSPTYGKHYPLVLKNRFRNRFGKNKAHKYLIILSPPHCGSTLLNQMISSSGAVSVNNPYGTREGQTLPTVRHIMFDHDRRWDPDLDFDWAFIKKEWRKYWNLNAEVLLEKSPASIVRAPSMEKVFSPAYFIVFYRNPYAHCESVMRRRKLSTKDAAAFAIRCLAYQRNNLQALKNTLTVSYEDLTNDPRRTVASLTRFMPELTGMDYEKQFTAHNTQQKKMKITNLNAGKIKKLTPGQLNEINTVFANHGELLDFFGYELIEGGAGTAG